MPKILTNTLSFNSTPTGQKIVFTPSESLYAPTSSAPSTAASYEIQIPSTLPASIINTETSRSGLDNDPIVEPYIKFELMSGSYTGGEPEELIIRFFTQSHFNNSVTKSLFDDMQGNINSNFGFNVAASSASLYFTSSNSIRTKYQDILVTPGASKGAANSLIIRDQISDAITSSAQHIAGNISQSNSGNLTSSIFYIKLRRATNTPTIHTGSIHADSGSGFKIKTLDAGSGTILNYSENYIMNEASASLIIESDPDDRGSIIFNQGTSSLGYISSGNTKEPTLFYFSGSGRVGLGTTKPESDFDVRADSFKVQNISNKRGIQVNDEGNIESFSNEATAAATGSEVILKYSRGVAITRVMFETVFGITDFDSDDEAELYFNSLGPAEQQHILHTAELKGFIAAAQVGDKLGSIRWVAESGSNDAIESRFDPRASGEAAKIEVEVDSVSDAGVTADLLFNIATAASTAPITQLKLDAGGNHEITGNISASGTGSFAYVKTSGNVSASGDLSIFGEVVHLEGTDPRLKLKAKGANHPGIEWHEDSTRKWVLYNDPDESDKLVFKNDTTELVKISQTGDISASGEIEGTTGSFSKSKIGQRDLGYSEHTSAGSTAQGDIVYFGNTTTVAGSLYALTGSGTWHGSDADGDDKSLCTGSLAIALGTNSTTHGMLLRGMVQSAASYNASSTNVGAPIYVSTTATRMSTTAPTGTGDVVRVVGYHISGSQVLYFNPDNTWIELS